MTINTFHFKSSISLIPALIFSATLCFTSIAQAQGLPANVQAKIETYKTKLVGWASDPSLIAAVSAANAKGPLAGMGNAKWTDLDEKDPIV